MRKAAHDEKIANLNHPPDSLTETEAQWLDELVAHIALGYGVGRSGRRAIHIRSGIYAGIMAALFATVHQMTERDGDSEMFRTGRDEAERSFRESAEKYRLLPLP